MADLPPNRLDPGPPFTNIGFDVFGDFKVKIGKAIHSCSVEKKVLVMLFTCLSRHAVHLELRDILDTSTFMNSFHCFLGIRGKDLCLEVTKARTLWVPETKTKQLTKRLQST